MHIKKIVYTNIVKTSEKRIMKIEIKEDEQVKRNYFQINEATARSANNANSMSDYKEGYATEIYKSYVDKVYDAVEKIQAEKPQYSEKAKLMADRYSRKLADYYNAYYRNEARCPSVLISGAGNFPVRKKEKQNSRRETLMKEWNDLQNYADKIKNILTNEQPILSNDEDAVEKLEQKLRKLKDLQEEMKEVNKAIRMKDTEKGNEKLRSMGYSEVRIKQLREPDFCGRVGYPSYALQNNNANIHRVEARLKTLKATKDRGSQETENKFFRVVENTENMRLQIFFDGKPECEVRDILKSHGFRWSPSQSAWQRQLTDNARYALKNVIEQMNNLDTVESTK